MNKVANKLQNISSALEAFKTPYTALWQWAIKFSAGDSDLRHSSQTGQEQNTESMSLDDEAFDPNIKSMMTTAKDYYGGLFFPAHEPWTVMPSYVSGASITPEVAAEANKRIAATFSNPESRWYEAREIFLDYYIRLGTGDLYTIETGDISCPFKVRSFGVWGMSIGRDHQEQYQVYNWTAQEIIDEFGIENIKNQDVLRAFEQYDTTRVFKVYNLICRNNEYSKDAKRGKKSRKYIGYWFLDNYEIIGDPEYFPEKPFNINRYSIRQGKAYGFSPLLNMKESFRALEGVFFLTMTAIGKMADPRMGYFDLGQIGALELDDTSQKYIPFNAGILGSGQNPIFPIQDVGDISGMVQFIRPEIMNGLRAEYKLDAMAEYFAKGGNPRTATEIMAINNVKNKMIAPQVKRFAEQLSEFRYRVTMIVLRSMIKDESFAMDDKVRKDIEDNKPGLFVIDETSIVKRIIYSEKLEQFTSDLQIIGGAMQMQPSLAPAIDLYDALTDVLSYGIVKLKGKEEYEEKRAAAEQAAMEIGTSQARAATAQADKIEQEAVNG